MSTITFFRQGKSWTTTFPPGPGWWMFADRCMGIVPTAEDLRRYWTRERMAVVAWHVRQFMEGASR